jgi:hypothetical protein
MSGETDAAPALTYKNIFHRWQDLVFLTQSVNACAKMRVFKNLRPFGVFERGARYELPFLDNNATVKCIMKAYHDFRQTVVQPNI